LCRWTTSWTQYHARQRAEELLKAIITASVPSKCFLAMDLEPPTEWPLTVLPSSPKNTDLVLPIDDLVVPTHLFSHRAPGLEQKSMRTVALILKIATIIVYTC
jgi:hypothetical protein